MNFLKPLFLICLSIVISHSAFAGFYAPAYTDKTKIVDPEVGSIVLDSTDGKFYGNLDGTSTGWTSLSPVDPPIVTCWTNYTPTWSSTDAMNLPVIGTATLNGKWRRVGDTMEIVIFFKSNGATSFGLGDWLFSLPEESVSVLYKVDSTKVISDSNNDSFVGVSQMKENDGSYYTMSSIVNDPLNSSYLRVKGATGTVNSSYPFTWDNTSNDTMSIKASVPIFGWQTKTPTMALNCN